MADLITTLGPIPAEKLGMILPHEHVFVDLRTWDQEGYAQADPDDVERVMKPELERARTAGVTALVECSTVGVGRRVDILKKVSMAADFPIVAPTGVYREPWVPDWVQRSTEDGLYHWMVGELIGEIENSGVQAGFIKLSAGDDGLMASEIKILRAAGRAALKTGAAIGSHTIRGWVVNTQLEILDSLKLPANKFIWIHAQVEPETRFLKEIGQRGAWIEIDNIGWEPDDHVLIDRIQFLLDAGFEDQVLLSHDRGWYDPAQPNGGTPKPYTYLSEVFIDKLMRAGIGDLTIRKLTCSNPFKAFAR